MLCGDLKDIFTAKYAIEAQLWNKVPQEAIQSKNDKMGEKHTRDFINIAVFNAQSLKNKLNSVKQYLTDNDIDISLISESWLKDDDYLEISKLQDRGQFQFIHDPWERERNMV